MPAPAAFIAGDWGTSNLRLSLCARDATVLETVRGPGAAEARGRFAEVFDGLTAPWLRQHGPLPAVLCGMAGSAFGWREAPYLPCPAELAELTDALVEARAGVRIVPGMRCTNPLGAPDVIRGEETQLRGALLLNPELGQGRQLACLPGTHTKWVSLHDGIVQEFLTAPTGELFAVLCEHTVLVRDPATPVVHRQPEFEMGLAAAARHPEVPLLHRLFQSRSLRLDRQLSAEGAASWTSGLLIGTDVGGALALFAAPETAPVWLIGAPVLTHSYEVALAKRGRRAISISGDAAVLAGLAVIHREREQAS